MRFSLTSTLSTGKPLIGMVHLLPLPGSPGWGGSMDAVVERALADATALETAGFDGLMVENYGDIPFYSESVPVETLAAVAVCVREVVRASKLPVGVNLLRNDGPGAMAIAHAAGARFIRVNVHTGVMITDQGLISGQAHETLRIRTSLGADVAVFADVWVKHATPFPGSDLEQAAEDTYHRGLADALIVSGSGTGKPTDPDRIARICRVLPDAPILIGSGINAENVQELLTLADGAIVGSCVKVCGQAGEAVDPARAAAFIKAARR